MRYFAFAKNLFSKKQAAAVFSLSILAAFPITSLFAADVTIAVNASTETRTIPDELFGQNLAVWESTINGDDKKLNTLMANSGTRFVRYPGGSYADIVVWDTVGKSPSTAWMRSTEDCIRFADSYGAKLQVIVNFSGYWDNTQHDQAQTVAKAAEEVRYMNITKKLGVKYWEIGNESGGFWEQGHTNALDYGSRFADFYKAMKAVDPTILIGAVSDPYDNEPQPGTDIWVMRDMFAGAKKKGVIPDFLIIHTYPNNESMSPENDGKLMTAPDTIAVLTANLDAMVKKYVGQGYVGRIKYFMTEYRSSLGSKLQVMTYADAMFTAQYIMEMAKYGWGGANIWDIKNGIDTVNGADYGIISQSWRIEAESGTLKAPAKTASEGGGFSGGGYVTGFANNNKASVAYDIEVDKEGTYSIFFRYSNGTADFQNLSVYANGVHVKDIAFPSTGDWKTYTDYSKSVKLPAGKSVLSLSSDEGDGSINLDWLSVSGAIPPTEDGQFRLPTYNDEPRPVYYVFPFLINKMGKSMVSAVSSNPLIRAYAGKDTGGNLTLFMVNNSHDAALTAQINLTGFTTGTTGEKWVMEPAGQTPTGNTQPLAELCDVQINGKLHPDPANIRDMEGIPVTVGSTFTMRLAAASMVIVKVPALKEAPVKYEAEKATVTGGAFISAIGEGFSGSAFVMGYDKKPDAATTFKLSVPVGGKYKVVLRYANGAGKDQAVALYLNNTYLKDTICAALGDWNAWGDKSETLTLVPGNNEISYRSGKTAAVLNIDYILLIAEAAGAKTNVYEAENAVLSHGVAAMTAHQGYSGASYVEGFYNNIGAAVTFKVDVETAGKYNVTLRYSNSMGSAQKISILVNGVPVANPSYPNLKDWDTWSDKTETLLLKAGENTIKYTSVPGDGCINIDYIRVDPEGGPAPATAAAQAAQAAAEQPKPANIYEAENAVLAKGAWAATSHLGYSGSAYVEGFYNNIGASLTFKVNVETAGKYNVTLHFSNSMGMEQKISILVNGVKVADPSYPNLKNWSTWADKTEKFTLKSGENTISYTSMSGDGCINFDYIRVDPAQ